MVRCTVHKHSSEQSAVRCARKAFERRNRRRQALLDRKLAPLAGDPKKHRLLRHKPPRPVQRGFFTLLVWSEATVLMY